MAIKSIPEKKEIYLRSWSIETGAVENLYDLSEGTTLLFLKMGFVADIISHKDKVNQCINSSPEELLRAQRAVVVELLSNVGISLTKKLITDLHEKFLFHIRFSLIKTSFRNTVVLIRKGKFKIVPNIVEELNQTDETKYYVYCAPQKVEGEIAKLLELYQKYRNQGCSPLILSAWLHHKYIQIHPFQDGNGRVCRSIASLILIEKSLPPVIIFKKKRQDYFKALQAANANDDLDPLIQCMIDNFKEAFKVVDELVSNKY